MNTGEAPAESSKSGKKTRRRLRVSCVECTKRRQKCDRNVPCSLCISRGVAHLCRWESAPVVRPPPARPPAVAPLVSSSPTDHDSLVQELTARVALLENELALQKLRNTSSSKTSHQIDSPQDDFSREGSGASSMRDSPKQLQAPQASTSFLPSISISPPPSQLSRSPSPPPPPVSAEGPKIGAPAEVFFEDPLYEAAAILGQLAVGHYGEYIGRGSLICAMYSISSKNIPRFLYARSTDVIGGKREETSKFSELSSLNSVQDLLRVLPPIPVVNLLIDAFFSEVNWVHGVPEEWFRSACSQMWTMLQYPGQYNTEVNANWLTLLFSVLACSPKHAYEVASRQFSICNSNGYFMGAIGAKRIAENDFLNRPGPNTSVMNSAADGTVLSCFATSLIAYYLFEGGRASEAWKLVGHGIRSAHAVGMHRDPDWPYWQVMSEDEKLLRRRAWWNLFISDRFYSYAVGRPSNIRNECHDVKLPSSLNSDGSHNIFNHGLAAFVSLANLVSEAAEACFGLQCPDIPTFMRMDDRLVDWESHLPPEYRYNAAPAVFEGFTAEEKLMLSRQRYMLLTWYMITRLKISITSCILANPFQTATSKECVERGIAIALELLRFQCDAYTPISTRIAITGPGVEFVPGNSWSCGGCFSMLEACVSLVTTLGKYPLPEKVTTAEYLINRAMGIFVEVSHDTRSAEIAAVAIEILSSLRRQPWWKNLVGKNDPHSESRQMPEHWDTSNLHRLLSESVKFPETLQVDDVSTFLYGSHLHGPSSSTYSSSSDIPGDTTSE